MSTHKQIDKICCVAVIIALLISVIFMNGESLGIQATAKVMGYENRLFDTSTVHTIDIVMDDWDSFIDTCQSEEYSSCTVVIDGEAYKNVGIRGKGNTSLTNVSSMNSDRYSFKVEFDQYDSSMSYHGLDKLSLNNIIQDNTFMKDYVVYQMMGAFGVDAPLCSYVYITVNGEDWGLYLAVEGIEDSFLQRNYGSDYGELYKPDSMSFGGGRGNGKDFNMDDFDFSESDMGNFDFSEMDMSSFDPTAMGGGMQMPEGMEIPEGTDSAASGGTMQMPDGMEMPEDFDPTTSGSEMQIPQGSETTATDNYDSEVTDSDNNNSSSDNSAASFGNFPSGNFSMEDSQEKMGDFADKMGNGGGMGGKGSDDVKLQYIDDDPDSYSNIFNNAKTDITEADQERLIESLKSLSNYENLEDVINIEEVIRYFVVHNFVVNGDSYTGSMIHNYYLYEEDGQLSMIPWDYNLAFGTFQGSNATSAVNDSIDYSDGSMEDRPMLNWIFEDEEYTELYYQYFAEFISEYFDSGYFAEMIDSVTEMIAPYVEKDPTKFCTYEEFELGAETLKQFCLLRAESVSNQLEGDTASVDASSITISDMGTMSMGGGGFGDGNMGNDMQMSGGNMGDGATSGFGGRNNAGGNMDSFGGRNNADGNMNSFDNGNASGDTVNDNMSDSNGNITDSNNPNQTETPDIETPDTEASTNETTANSTDVQNMNNMQIPNNAQMKNGMQMPDGAQMPNNMQMPDGAQMQNNMQMPDGAQMQNNMQMPDGAQMQNGMQMPDGTQTTDNIQTVNTTQTTSDTQTSDDSQTSDDVQISGNVQTSGDTQVSNDSQAPEIAPNDTDPENSNNTVSDVNPPEIPGFNGNMQAGIDQNTLILLGACGIILLFGLIFAYKYRRN